jgi:uncharacterized glyoxalase superfamily protein PhnB
MLRIVNAQIWVHDQDEALALYTQKVGLEVTAKGGTGTVLLATDDCQASYEELSARGVEFTELPEKRPYGFDCGFRDVSGNNVRLTQSMEMATP